MTGLRISDILQLSWEHIQMGQDGGYLIRLCTEKTEEETNLPISDETLALCGERSEGLVFKGLKRHMVNHPERVDKVCRINPTHHFPHDAPQLRHAPCSQRC